MHPKGVHRVQGLRFGLDAVDRAFAAAAAPTRAVD